MESLLCAHCDRRIFLRRRQPAPASGLCVPCSLEAVAHRSATRAWLRFRDRLLEPADAATATRPLAPLVDLRHL